jgi:hypothetical protein
MILIISFSNDVSTQHVCQWLQFLRKKYLIITEKSILTDINITYDYITLSKNAIKYNLNSFNNIWYRRGRLIYKKDKPRARYVIKLRDKKKCIQLNKD